MMFYMIKLRNSIFKIIFIVGLPKIIDSRIIVVVPGSGDITITASEELITSITELDK